MKLSDECANITLSTLDSQNPTFPYNADFNNIDMRNLSGDMDAKYDKFALIRTSVSYGNSSAPAMNSANQQHQYLMSGFSFYNAGYINSKHASNGCSATCTYNPQTITNFGSSMLRVCFNKPPPKVNLKITAEIMLTRTQPTFNTTFIHYQFAIYGLYD